MEKIEVVDQMTWVIILDSFNIVASVFIRVMHGLDIYFSNDY